MPNQPTDEAADLKETPMARTKRARRTDPSTVPVVYTEPAGGIERLERLIAEHETKRAAALAVAGDAPRTVTPPSDLRLVADQLRREVPVPQLGDIDGDAAHAVHMLADALEHLADAVDQAGAEHA